MADAKPDKLNYLECWTQVATTLFAQALAGEPVLSESLPKPMPAKSFGFAATLGGDESGRFAVLLDGSLLEAPLLGEGEDQRAGWAELLREVADSAAGELLARTERTCKVIGFEPIESERKLSRAFQLRVGERSWSIHVSSEVKQAKADAASSVKVATGVSEGAQREKPSVQASPTPNAPEPSKSAGGGDYSPASPGSLPAQPRDLSPGFELLLDVELEASLRFGAKEMPLGEILDLGPGDVVQLDRHITDPVDLIVGDKIVARGEVVLVNGNFGLRVTEVAEPQKRLESIRCLF